MDDAARWAIAIDIEGFGRRWEEGDESGVRQALAALVEGVYLVGGAVCTDPAERFFAHQLADGFLIVADLPTASLAEPVAIAIALLQHVATTRRYAKAAIAEGGFADFAGDLSDRVRNARDSCGHLRIGYGRATLLPVIGTAHIRAYIIANKASDALLLVPEVYRPRLPDGLEAIEVAEDVLAVDWLHADLPRVCEIQRQADLDSRSVEHVERALLAYFRMKPVPTLTWSDTTRRALHLPTDVAG